MPIACRAAEAGRRRAGFTLVELMATLAVIGLAMSAVYWGSRSLLPQTRLRTSATTLGSALEQTRLHAVLMREPLRFVYDLDHTGFESYFPYVRGEKGRNLGPGRTPVHDFRGLEAGVRIRYVRIPGSEPRRSEQVELLVSPEGRVVPHEVVLENPEHPDTEVVTLHVDGLHVRYEVAQGDTTWKVLVDADFR